MERILVYGQGGHSKVIQMMITKSLDKKVSLIVDDDKKKLDYFKPVKVIQAQELRIYKSEFDSVIVAIGANVIRKKIVESSNQKNYATIIDRSSIVANDVVVEPGTVIMPLCVINPSAHIGKHCIINTGAIVEHDCSIGDYSHISPGVVLTGGVKIGQLVHIGANATILPSIIIGDNVTIGAGAVVTKNVGANKVMVGNPAIELVKEGEK